MNRFNFMVILLFGASAISAKAGDLSSIKACVSQGYSAMSNRHGIVAAVVDADGMQIMTFGAARADQLFEIGSITKTFTANLLAQSVYAGSIKVTDAIPAIYQKSGSTITYQNLTTHTSGIIEGIFPAFQIKNQLSPFEGLTIPLFKTLYAETPLATSPSSAWSYSNIGMSLLGLILAENSDSSYEVLVRQKILTVLGLNDTYFHVPDSELHRFAEGHMIDPDGPLHTMPHWDLYKTAIDPAGGLRSSITDMAKYAQANLNPDGSALAGPIRLSQQQLYFIKDHNMGIGMNWILQPDAGLIWHNGETYGFNSILAISTKKKQAIVAMTDTTQQVKDANGNVTFDTSLQDVAFSCLK